MSTSTTKALSAEQRDELFNTIKARFEKNNGRHDDLEWAPIQAKLEADSDKLWSLYEMEKTGGEPDVISYDENADEYLFCDCSVESPQGRRSLCYDRNGLESRKDNRPEHNAVDMAADMGIDLLDEAHYRALQRLGTFDAKTSSWLNTPDEIRKMGGALFADFRYGQVFVYHNGAQSYYGARGFRGSLKV